VLIGDDRLFFLFCTNAAGYGWYGRNSYCFGDLISFKPADNYATVLAADDNYSGNEQLLELSRPVQRLRAGLSRWTSRARCCCATTPSSATRCASG
jgi:hypothetical protein